MPALLRIFNETPGSIVTLVEASGREVTIRGGENGTGHVLANEPITIVHVQEGWPEPTPAPTPAPTPEPTPAPSLVSRLLGR